MVLHGYTYAHLHCGLYTGMRTHHACGGHGIVWCIRCWCSRRCRCHPPRTAWLLTHVMLVMLVVNGEPWSFEPSCMWAGGATATGRAQAGCGPRGRAAGRGREATGAMGRVRCTIPSCMERMVWTGAPTCVETFGKGVCMRTDVAHRYIYSHLHGYFHVFRE